MGRMDQYTSQFLMEERIGPSQTDGNPALPGVVSQHCLLAGNWVFGATAHQQGNDCYDTGAVIKSSHLVMCCVHNVSPRLS